MIERGYARDTIEITRYLQIIAAGRFDRFDKTALDMIRRDLRDHQRDLEAQLDVENLFNKGYWASADGNNNLSPGQPRTIRLKVTARF